MEHGTIEREIHVKASAEVVFEVITSPEHLKEWWPDDVELDPVPGAIGKLTFGDPSSPDAQTPEVTVVAAEPPRLFSFRWVYPEDEVASPTNSLLVTFEITPDANGCRVRMTETGFREQGWEIAVLEQAYQEHVDGWNHFIPRLDDYVARVVPMS